MNAKLKNFHTVLNAANKLMFQILYEPTFWSDKICILELKNIALLGGATVKINKAKPRTIKVWSELIEKLSFISIGQLSIFRVIHFLLY